MKPILRLFLAIFFCTIIFQSSAVAVESRSQREASIAPRTKKFFKGNRAKQYISLTGNYSSNNTSRTYQANVRYLYQSWRYIHELNFDHEVKYADTGSGKKKIYDAKTSESYDGTFASKVRFFDSKFYGVFYHRMLYDDMSSYYYDHRTALGLGTMLFDEKLELDFSSSSRVVKDIGQETDYIISYRLNHKILTNLTINQRSYFFIDKNSLDLELRTSLVYRLNQKLSAEIRHNFEKRRYRDLPYKPLINNVSRSISVGLVFDLGSLE
jgi:hypothetical protein